MHALFSDFYYLSLCSISFASPSGIPRIHSLLANVVCNARLMFDQWKRFYFNLEAASG